MLPRLALAVLLLSGCAAGPVAGRADPTAWRCSGRSTVGDDVDAVGAGRQHAEPGGPQRPCSASATPAASPSRDLGLAAAAPPVVDGGPAIADPILHAGVVTNMADEAGTRLLRGTGRPARSVGSAALGRRIYLGPFATQGALDGATALARAAGFASPYPATF